LLIVGLVQEKGFAQVNKTHHVISSTLNMRSGAGVENEKVHTFKQYDNLTPLEFTANGWAMVIHNNLTEIVSAKYLKVGKAVVSTSSYRTGAICRDGTHSSTTGKGACSHHGGVSRWLYGENKSVRIVYD
jgi:hypothetical protein